MVYLNLLVSILDHPKNPTNNTLKGVVKLKGFSDNKISRRSYLNSFEAVIFI